MFRELVDIGIRVKIDELKGRCSNAHEHEAYDDHHT